MNPEPIHFRDDQVWGNLKRSDCNVKMDTCILAVR